MSNENINNDEIIICENCGNENPKELNACSGCGAFLNKIVAEELSTDNNSSGKQNKNIKVSDRKKKNAKLDSSVEKEKVINPVKLVYLIVFLFFAGALVLVLSGTFDSPKIVNSVNNNSTQNFDDVHKGVDMSSFQEISRLETQIEKNPQDYDALLNLAHLLNDSQLNDRAITYYNKYLEKFPTVADVIIDLGVCYYEVGQNKIAIETMTSALKYEPNHQIAHLNLGIVNLASNNHEEALAWWKKAVEIDPNSNIGQRAKELLNQH